MANVTQTVSNTFGFSPEIWAHEGLELLKANLVLAKLATKDTSIEPGWQGKQLNVRVPGVFTASKKSANTATTVSVPTGGTTIPVVLDQHAYVDFLVEDVAQAQAQGGVSIRENLLKPAILAISEQIETDCWTAAAFTASVGTYGTNISFATLLAAKKALTDARIPQDGRNLIISTKDENALIADTTLAAYFANAKDQVITEGAIARIAGFDIFVSQLAPFDATPTPDEQKGLALHPSGLVFATRPLEEPPAGSGVQCMTVVDEGTGVALRLMYSYDVGHRAVRVNLDVLYGVRKYREAAGVLVKS